MSHVDNYILVTMCGDDEDVFVEQLNRLIETEEYAPWVKNGDFFRRVDGSAGGPKHVEADVYMGAGYVPRMVDAVMGIKWRDRAKVQLFVKCEDDERFVELSLGFRA